MLSEHVSGFGFGIVGKDGNLKRYSPKGTLLRSNALIWLWPEDTTPPAGSTLSVLPRLMIIVSLTF